MEKDGEILHRCVKCGYTFSMRTCTSVLNMHLGLMGFFVESDKQRRLCFDASLTGDIPSPLEDLQTRLDITMCKWIVIWIVMTLQRLDTVDDPNFRRMIFVCNPSFVFSSSNYIPPS